MWNSIILQISIQLMLAKRRIMWLSAWHCGDAANVAKMIFTEVLLCPIISEDFLSIC